MATGLPVPNEVFRRTREGLSSMVSARAAQRILSAALSGSGHTPDDVDGAQMRRALLGPVLSELEGVLPVRGLRARLERLAMSLPHSDPASDAGSPTAERPRTLLTGSFEPRGGVAVLDPDAPPKNATAEPVPSHAAVDRGGENGPAVAPQRVLDDAELERRVARLTQIDHVRLVAAVRADGTVPVCRGTGPDVESLVRMGRLAMSMLARAGTVRSMHVGHTRGHLFLLPLGPDLLLLLGEAEMNLGAVTTAFTALALEEDL